MRVRTRKDFGQIGKPTADKRQSARVSGSQHRPVRSFAQRPELFELEQMVQVAEGFLLGNDGDVVLGGISHQFTSLIGGHGAAGKSRHWRGRVSESVLEIGREDVDLVSRQGANLALEKLHIGQGSARPVVGDAAMGHGGPVAQSGFQQHCIFSAAANQLLHGLRAVEYAGGRFRCDHQPAP